MGHTRSHDEQPLPVIYVGLQQPERIIDYVGNNDIKKVIVDAVHFFPKDRILSVVERLLVMGIDVYVNGLIFDYRKHEYGATKRLMEKANETIELFSICVRCGGKAPHTERISGGIEQSIGTIGSNKAEYIAVCSSCHKVYRG
jgi:thymidine kinase